MSRIAPDPTFEALLEYLETARGFDFSGYKRMSLMRRVLKRMGMLNVQGFTEYIDYLELHPAEFGILFNTILINVTSFFRDQDAWNYLATDIVPKILEQIPSDEPIRVWSAGCASGQEAYSIAMLLSRALGGADYHKRVKIYATDVDEEALQQARQATYSAAEVSSLEPDYLEEFFVQANGKYMFRQDMRRTVIFGRLDLLQDAPISHLDLLICRNTLMYLNAETQSHIISRMHFALKDTGFLFLGKAEMLLSHATLFSQVDLRYRVFAKVAKLNLRDRLLASTDARHRADEYLDEQSKLAQLAFDSIARAYFLIDAEGNLAAATERARRLFGILPIDLGKPFRDLEISFSPIDLRSLIDEARTTGKTVKVNRVMRNNAAGVDCLDVEAEPIKLEKDGTSIYLGTAVGFEEMTDYYKLHDELLSAQEELETTNEELQSTNEELETTNEELQSTNEELETTNEELQSSNEELETTNEELHSANEELETINQELQSVMSDVHDRHRFLDSVLSSMKSAVIAIDNDMRVTVWSHRAEDMWGVTEEEALGQTLDSLDIGLPLSEKELSSQELDATGRYLVLEALNRRGKRITCEIWITPVQGDRSNIGLIVLVDDASK
jgi:two-component system CheB/CheR fusion protein